jgi:archaellum component FlaF (FlaF/FlaG flagellin family)
MLEKLRAKPEHVKKSIALSSTSVIFGIVFLAWVSSWDARQNEEQAREQAVSPLAGFTQMIKGITADVKDTYSASPDAVTEDFMATTTTPESQKATVLDASRIKVIDQALMVSTSTSTTTVR